jgi:hypothetical protein
MLFKSGCVAISVDNFSLKPNYLNRYEIALKYSTFRARTGGKMMESMKMVMRVM